MGRSQVNHPEAKLAHQPSAPSPTSQSFRHSFNLTREQQAQYGIVILKRGNSYFWASREMKPLIHSLSGAFHYFIEPNGGGYIKVFDRRLLMEEKNPRFLYLEHVTLWMQTITYWGTADAFSP